MTRQEQIKKIKEIEDEVFEMTNIVKSNFVRKALVDALDKLQDAEIELATSFTIEK